jgi:SAM-dependent methyltransferase
MKESPRNFCEQRLWDDGYVQAELFVAPPDDLIRRWLQKHVPSGQGSCLELGCFPGRYLAVLGELGYEVNGIDLTPRVEQDLKPWLQRQGYRVGEFIRDDVFTHAFRRRYDIVCSFGLIEHFEDWPGLLRRHAGSQHAQLPRWRTAALTPLVRSGKLLPAQFGRDVSRQVGASHTGARP